MERATRAAYSAVMWLVRPLLRLKLARRARAEPGYGEAVEQRFGHYAFAPPGPGYVWLHAVSLGETRAAVALIARLRERLPGMRLLLTSGTATGRAEAERLLAPGDLQVWQPWDTPGAAQRFLEHFKPRIGVLMETEIWPNLCAACERAGIPLVLANARMSEKSFRRTEPFAWLARPAYRSLAAVWAQTEADADRLRRLGAPVAGVFGNLKFDAEPSPQQLAAGRAVRAASDRPIVMFASSREGEELLLVQYLKQKWPSPLVSNGFSAINIVVSNIQWLIVPRHPQRFDQVAQLIARQGFSVARRSEWSGQGATPPPADIWLGDSLGEMALYYGMSDVALLGGSFEPLGG
ncbi:MAG: 3-deoxy-D-manno-octulosonic acid transferase, partial [Burkholderiales bacterium]